MPGPRISSRTSLPSEKYFATEKIKYPYTRMRNIFPTIVLLQGIKPYGSSQVSDGTKPLRSRNS
ncbi:unnamed protein product, partial [Ilex paraguariensis]